VFHFIHAIVIGNKLYSCYMNKEMAVA